MSAFMVDDKHIDYLLTAAMQYGDHGHMTWVDPAVELPPFSSANPKPWELACAKRRKQVDHTNASEVGMMLLGENLKSVNHRYDENELEAEVYEYNRYPGRITPVQTIKAVRCFEYQACEHPDWEKSEAKSFCDSLTVYAIQHLPGYDDAEWEVRA